MFHVEHLPQAAPPRGFIVTSAFGESSLLKDRGPKRPSRSPRLVDAGELVHLAATQSRAEMHPIPPSGGAFARPDLGQDGPADCQLFGM